MGNVSVNAKETTSLVCIIYAEKFFCPMEKRWNVPPKFRTGTFLPFKTRRLTRARRCGLLRRNCFMAQQYQTNSRC